MVTVEHWLILRGDDDRQDGEATLDSERNIDVEARPNRANDSLSAFHQIVSSITARRLDAHQIATVVDADEECAAARGAKSSKLVRQSLYVFGEPFLELDLWSLARGTDFGKLGRQP